MADNVCIILTSVESESDSMAIAEQLVEAGLAACVQISAQGQSVYRWQGEIQKEAEHYLSIKTTEANRQAVMAWLEKNHPYDTPEILCLDAEASRDYLHWMRATIE